MVDPRLFTLLLAHALVAAAIDASAAGVHRCQSAGRAVYQDRPCAPGEEVRDLDAQPPTLSVIPFAVPQRDAASASRAERPHRPPRAHASTKRKHEAARSESEVAERRHVRDGMSDGEVMARLGPPDLKAAGGKRGASWTYLPAAGDAQTVTLVRFEGGKVVAVERKIVR